MGAAITDPALLPVKQDQADEALNKLLPSPSVSSRLVSSPPVSSLAYDLHSSVFNAPPLVDPYQPFPLAWDKNSNILPINTDRLTYETMVAWTPPVMADFVAKLPGCSALHDRIIQQVVLFQCYRI